LNELLFKLLFPCAVTFASFTVHEVDSTTYREYTLKF